MPDIGANRTLLATSLDPKGIALQDRDDEGRAMLPIY
jgi:hypothetical protein